MSDNYNDDVVVFDFGGKVVAVISQVSSPEGLAVDAVGNVYVTDGLQSNVQVYKNDYHTLIAILSDPRQYPFDVAVDRKTGLVGVANLYAPSNGPSGPGSVSFYGKGKTTACKTVYGAGWARVDYAAFDSTGRLYVDGTDAQNNPLVGDVDGGCAASKITTLATANTFGYSYGIAVGPSNRISIVEETSTASEVVTYDPPSNGTLGTPVSTTAVAGNAIVLTKSGSDIYVNDETRGVFEYAFPAGGAVLKTFKNDLASPVGVALAAGG